MPPRKKPEKVKEEIGTDSATSEAKEVKAKVRRLKIRDFGCISEEIDIELDDIVVLVGPNNSGKSTILRAYEIAMGGTNEHTLPPEDLYGGDERSRPCITLETQVQSGNEPADEWLNPADGRTIRERWIWEPSKKKLVREGFSFTRNEWVKEVPYGAKGVANWHRPKPHRLGAFDQPADRMKQITKLLSGIITDKLRNNGLPSQAKQFGEQSETLLDTLRKVSNSIKEQAQGEIAEITEHLTRDLCQVFPMHKVRFDPQATPTDELVAGFIESLFNNDAKLKFGHESDFKSTVDKQGTGAQRMLMWAVLRYLAENVNSGKPGRSHILLIDEPELCLHPSAIRDVARTLYELPKNGTWQVMISTHSPVFLDLTRENTAIVRVERSTTNAIGSTTVFRRSDQDGFEDGLKFDHQNKEHLKLLNICDPYFTEFLFGGQTLVVEGDTEYAAFKHIVASDPSNPRYRALHIVRARGKNIIRLVLKLLNRFNASYSVLHDSDLESNSANEKILMGIKETTCEKFLVACIPNFEIAMFEAEPPDDDKPFFALQKMTDSRLSNKVKALLDALISYDAKKLPASCINWSTTDELLERVSEYSKTPRLQTAFDLP